MRANAIITKLNHETQEAMQTRAHDVDVIGNIVNYERSSSQVEFLQLAQLVPWHGTILKRGPGCPMDSPPSERRGKEKESNFTKVNGQQMVVGST